MPKDQPKLCVQCKHYRPRLSSHFALDDCLHPENMKPDLVHGGETTRLSPQNFRDDNFKYCGSEGRFFELRPDLEGSHE